MMRSINIKKLVAILAIIFIGSASIAGIIFFIQYGVSGFSFSNIDSYEKTINEEKTSELHEITSISIESQSEDINIISTNSSELKAHFYGGYSSGNKSYKPELVLSKDEGRMHIKIDDNHNGLNINYRSNLKLDVYIPSPFSESISVKSISGEVTTGDLSIKNLSIRTTSGDIKADYVNAFTAVLDSTSGEINAKGKFNEFSVKTTSGDFISENIEAAAIELESTSGEIKMSGNLGNTIAKSISGDISLYTSVLSDNMGISTTSGETILKLPDTATFKLTCKSTSGEIDCDFPVTVTGYGKEHELNGTVGNGSSTVAITSSSGDISIRK